MFIAHVCPQLGAFLAGALLAETNYRTQVEADIRPFRGLLLGLFFVTTGTSIDMSVRENTSCMDVQTRINRSQVLLNSFLEAFHVRLLHHTNPPVQRDSIAATGPRMAKYSCSFGGAHRYQDHHNHGAWPASGA